MESFGPFSSVILKGSRVAEIDAKCIASGTDSKWLMQNAGSSVANVILRDLHFRDQVLAGEAEKAKAAGSDKVAGIDRKGIIGTVICGSGNNGGDGFVAAIDLINAGVYIKIFYIKPVEKLTPDSKYYFEKLSLLVKENPHLASHTLLDIEDNYQKKEFLNSLSNSDFVIDAMFGTGLHDKEIFGSALKVIEAINSVKTQIKTEKQQRQNRYNKHSGYHRKKNEKCIFFKGVPVIYSVDIPSGIDSDNGKILGTTIKADKTITFGCKKFGIAVYPGKEFAGDVIVADIGIPGDYFSEYEKIYEVNMGWIASRIPFRSQYAYKHAVGKLLVIAGSPGYTGAASMTCQAALRAGAGIVTLVCPWELNNIFEIKLTEVMTYPVEQTDDATIHLDAFEEIEEISENYDALAIGPGLSKNPSTVCLVREILKNIRKPTVLDADGLRALYGPMNLDQENNLDLSQVIITPHSGELAAILGIDRIKLEKRLERNWEAVKKYGLVSVLKGAATLISNPQNETFINPTGSWALATAGTGDILTGIIGSLICQGMNLTDAAVAGTYIHGMASDIMLRKTGRTAQIATDLLEGLKKVFLEIEKIKY